MSVIIHGLDMPEYCYECPCHNGESGYCQAYKSGYLNSVERPAKCPLVPLPEGHGRLVDAREVLEKADKASWWFDGDVSELELLLRSEVTTIVPAEGGEADGN